METPFVPTDERTNRKFPLILTTGRILSQYNVGAQTRRTDNIAPGACQRRPNRSCLAHVRSAFHHRGSGWSGRRQPRCGHQHLQCLSADVVVRAEQRHALHEMPELTNIARPRVAAEPGAGALGETLRAQPVRLRIMAALVALEAGNEVDFSYLRDLLEVELHQSGRWELAHEDFQRACFVAPRDNHRVVRSGWERIDGRQDLSPRQQTILQELCLAREKIAARLDRPLFKVVDDRVLLRVAQTEPRTLDELLAAGLSERSERRGRRRVVPARTVEPVADPLAHRPVRRLDAGKLDESGGVSHGRLPPSPPSVRR